MSITEDDFGLGDALRKSSLKMPYAGFEEVLMVRVKAEAEKKRMRRYIAYSLLSFALFVVLGLTLYYNLPAFTALIGANETKSFKSVFQITFMFILLIMAERFIKFYTPANQGKVSSL